MIGYEKMENINYEELIDSDILELIRDSINEMRTSKRTLLLNPVKAKTVEEMYNILVSLLEFCGADYRIKVLQEEFFETTIFLRVLTDIIYTPTLDSMDRLKFVVDNSDGARINIYENKAVIEFEIHDVLIEVDIDE